MGKGLEIWVFGDHRNHPQDRLTLQVLEQARRLSGEDGRVTAVLLGQDREEMARTYIGHGAQRIVLLDDPHLRFYRADLFTTVIHDLMDEERPDIFLIGASDFGKELAPRIAKRIGVGLCADCVALEWDEKNKKLVASSPAFGGNYMARIAWSTHRPYMATVNAGACAERPYDEAARGEIVRVKKHLGKVPSKISVVSSERDPHPTAKLEEAEIVVVSGRGVKTPEGFNLVRELSMILGGEVGATRPVVDAHWASHDQLIGQTGKPIKPQLLITCGTSGAIQYTAAIRGTGTIVAVNRDPKAPIFKMADIGVVTDTQAFLPALLAEVRSHRFQEITDLYRDQVKKKPAKKALSFGQRVRKMREAHKLSLAELAEKIGQSAESIEEIESDRVTPPVSFLLQLSRAFHVDPSQFLTEQEKTQIVGKRQEAFIKRTQNYSYRTLTPGAADKHLRAFMITIEPKEKHKMVAYKHPGEEFIFVYKGELELTLGNKVHHLKQGETMHFDSETSHKLRNTSDEICELIVTLYTP